MDHQPSPQAPAIIAAAVSTRHGPGLGSPRQSANSPGAVADGSGDKTSTNREDDGLCSQVPWKLASRVFIRATSPSPSSLTILCPEHSLFPSGRPSVLFCSQLRCLYILAAGRSFSSSSLRLSIYLLPLYSLPSRSTCTSPKRPSTFLSPARPSPFLSYPPRRGRSVPMF